jgi:hypothetical protein
MENEFEKAMQDVIDYGMKAIDSLTPEQLFKLETILEETK